jgi:hypothetical protein
MALGKYEEGQAGMPVLPKTGIETDKNVRPTKFKTEIETDRLSLDPL